jgi:phosphoribosylformylglycinamidine synthase
MNFGNPEKPEIMGEFVECIRGMAESCSYLNYPVISGNVSLYNETNGVGIYPTPAIGGVGLIKDLSKTMTIGLKNEGNIICVIGETSGHLNMSQYLSIIKNKEEGSVPEINLEIEKKNGMFVLDCIEGHLTLSVHDIGEGGLLIAMSEMCMAGNLGVQIEVKKEFLHAYLFGEDQGRYLIEVSEKNYEKVIALAKDNSVHIEKLGFVGGTDLKINHLNKVSIAQLVEKNSEFFEKYTCE